jgi:hypothetical protein
MFALRFEHSVFPLSSVEVLRNIRFIGTQDCYSTGKQIKFPPWIKSDHFCGFRASVQMCAFMRQTEIFDARKWRAVVKRAFRAPLHAWSSCGVADNDENGWAV